VKAAENAIWALIAFLSIGVGGYAVFLAATNFQFLPPPIAANAFPSDLGLQTHIVASAIALILGPFQFLEPLREKAPVLHRWIGRIYVAACLAGGASGVAIALYSSSGLVAGLGFLLLGLLWLGFTFLALVSAMRRNFIAHERWMIRSFALTFAAVTLRIYLPIGLTTVGFDNSYTLIAWACWLPNLIVAELFIATLRKPERRSVTANVAA